VSNLPTEEVARFDRDPRFEIWVYAAERIRERPWSGYGYGRGILRSDFRTHFDNILKWHGHNVVIDYVMEAGVLGGVVIIGLFVALAMHAWRIYRSGDERAWRFGVWSLAMLAGIALKVMTDDILVRESSLLFWSALGMSFGVASRAGRRVGTT
jgi:O-antigen ligase